MCTARDGCGGGCAREAGVTIFSLCPWNFETTDAAEQLKKVVLHSVATALASSVLPVPGGPCRSTPTGDWWSIFCCCISRAYINCRYDLSHARSHCALSFSAFLPLSQCALSHTQPLEVIVVTQQWEVIEQIIDGNSKSIHGIQNR